VLAAVGAALATAGVAGRALAQSTADLQPTAERPILLLDQIRSARFGGEIARAVQPAKTLEEVEAILRANGVVYRRARALFDTRGARPDLVKLIAGLPRGEVYVIPQADAVTFNVVVKALTPEAAAALSRPAAQPKT
jgi:hypothetical protein